MRGKGSLLSFCVALGVLAIGVASSPAAVKPQTISLFEMDTSFTPTGGLSFTSHQPPAAGQGFITTGTYYKWAGTKRGAAIGHLQVICTITSFDSVKQTGQLQCNATAFLPGGTIVALGPSSFTAKGNDIPIVGGTGAYLGAQGYVHTRNIGGQNGNTSSDVIHIIN